MQTAKKGEVRFEVEGPLPRTGEVHFQGSSALEAAQKSLALNGTMIRESTIQVKVDPNKFYTTQVQ